MGALGSLCDSCAHARRIVNDRGSRFTLCRLSRDDPRFARYPRLPVWRCTGYREVSEPPASGEDETAPDPKPPHPEDEPPTP